MSDVPEPTQSVTLLHALGTAIGMILTGVISWIAGRGKRNLDASEISAGTTANIAIVRAIDRLEKEIVRLSTELDEVRASERKLRHYVGILIDVMLEHKIDVPPMPQGA